MTTLHNLHEETEDVTGDPALAKPSAVEDEADALDAYSRVVSRVAARGLPSVASLRWSIGPGHASDPYEQRDRPRGGGSGSAVVLSPDGYLLTAAHVVSGAEGGIAILEDGRTVGWNVVGRDPLSDLAVVRVAADGLVPIDMGNADGLRVGQLVVA